MTSSPIVARWELSRRLGTRRKELDLGVSAITDALGFTRNYWSAVENDRTLIAEDKLRQLFDVLQFEEPDKSELLALREASRERGWWDDYMLDEGQKRLLGMEYGADTIKTFESNFIPGMLQIPEYAEAVLAMNPAFSALALADHLELRRKRQERLTDTEPLRFIAILSEATLRQQVAGAEVQRSQLEHIAELTQSESALVEIRVIPFTTNPGAIAASSTLVLIELPSRHLPQVVWQEAGPLDIIDSEDDRFRRLELSWDQAMKQCMNEQDSTLIISQIHSELTR